MNERVGPETELDDLPFHEYCAGCDRRFDETILEPAVTIVETDDERVLHSFCDEECLSDWADEA